MSEHTGSPVDVAVATALAEERMAVLDAIGTPERRLWGRHEVHFGTIGGRRVLVLPSTGMGNPAAAADAAAAIDSWHPQCLLFVGIAGGFASAGVRLGDVLVSDQIVGYEQARLGSDGAEPRWEIYRPGHTLLAIAQQLGAPTVHFGPLLSGEKVIADEAALAVARRTWPRAIGVEMEGLGAALAGYRSDTPLLVVRGVSDLADRERDPSRRGPAAEAAARFAVEVVRRLPAVGPTDDALTAHWLPRANGFTGRVRVVAELVDWIAGLRDDRPRVVTGDPGSGKSAVLAWLVLRSAYPDRLTGDDEHPDPPRGAVVAAVHARDRTLAEVTAIIGQQAGRPGENIESLLNFLRSHYDRPPTVVIDALDESKEPAAILAKLARPLGGSGRDRPAVRLLVGTRRHLAGQLGPLATSLDLDTEYADLDAVRRCVQQVLLRGGQYAEQPDRARLVAGAVAAGAKRSFLIALLVGRALMLRADAAAVLERFPDTVQDAMDLYLAEVPGGRREAEDLLRPLAYAQGLGLPYDLWAELAGRLAGSPGQYAAADLTALLGGPVRSLLAVSRSDDEYAGGLPGSRSLYRLFHGALDECLRAIPAPHPEAPQDEPETRTDLVAALSRSRDWRLAHPYVRRHLATHAVGTPALDGLVADPGFLLAAEQDRLLAALPAVQDEAATQLRTAYLLVARDLRLERDWSTRAAYLAVGALRTGAPGASDRLAAYRAEAPWWPRTMVWRRLTAHRVVDHAAEFITRLVTTAVLGEPFFVAGSDDGVVRIGSLLRPETGVHASELGIAVRGLGVATLTGLPLLAVGGADGRLRVIDLPSGDLVETGDGRHRRPIEAVACYEGPDGPVVVSGTDDGELWCWSVLPCRPLPDRARIGPTEVSDLAAVRMGAIAGLAVCSGDGRVHVWVPGGQARSIHSGRPRATAVTGLDPAGRAVALVVAGHDDGSVRAWEAISGKLVAEHPGPGTPVFAIATAEVDGRGVAVVGGEDGDLRMVDLERGPVAGTLAGHGEAVNAVATTTLLGRLMALSAAGDDVVRLWDLRPDATGNHPEPALRLTVTDTAVRALTVADRRVALLDVDSGSRFAEEALPSAVGEPASSVIRSTLAAIGTASGQVAVLDLGGDSPSLVIPAHRDWVQTVSFVGPDLLTTSHDGVAARWNPATGDPVGPRLSLAALQDGVSAAAVTWWGGSAVGVFGGRAGDLVALDLSTGAIRSAAFTVGPGAVTALDPDPDRPDRVVVGLMTGDLFRYDLARRVIVDTVGPGHTRSLTVISHAVLHGRRVLVTAGMDGLVCVWDASADGGATLAVNVDAGVNDVLIVGGDLVVATDHGLVTLSISPIAFSS